ncbi:MAG TPA: MFS transporter [Dehalococcoidia bacterium]|nr:MFS transporter [Dehalococcoidia bacterium]HIK88919.1 MFS transporter [Dehalococcoidia bacterium]
MTDSSQENPPIVDQPPKRSGIYRGWYIIGASALSIGAVLGTVQFTFGFFIEPLEQEFGWSRTQVNVALSIGIVTGFLSPVIGGLMDRIGAKWTMAGSILLVAIGFLLRSVMTELWQFYLFSAVIFAGTPGATMMPAGRLVLTWFPKARGRMMGIVTSGNNIGSGIAVPVVAILIGVVGWRWTWGLMGIALVGMAMLVLLVIRDNAEDVKKEQQKRWAPAENGEEASDDFNKGLTASAAMRTSAFWFLVVGMTLQQFVRTGVVSQMVPHLEQVGFSRGIAATMMIVLAVFAASSKLIFGRLSESITARVAFILIMILQGIGLSVLLFSGGSLITWGAIVVFGLGMGGVGALTPLIIFDMFGLKQFGRIMGLTRMSVTIPVFFGPILAGMIFDSTGKYDQMFMITIVLLVISIGSFALAKAPDQTAVNEPQQN